MDIQTLNIMIRFKVEKNKNLLLNIGEVIRPQIKKIIMFNLSFA